MKADKSKGFLANNRELPASQAVEKRIGHNSEFSTAWTPQQAKQQSSRCMDCGVPFCHSACPLGNAIPEFNDAVYNEQWEEAYALLTATNNFPEFTGRICPAPCESACVLAINKPAVAIEAIEKHIVERAFEKGFVKPFRPEYRTGKKVAIIGSGPAGLAAADQLNAAGHEVSVFEKDDAAGGLLRYGIPDFKLDKAVVDRRLKVMEQSGIVFRYHANVGVNVFMSDILSEFDAVVLAGGAMVPRRYGVSGHQLHGIYSAMPFLKQHNKRVAGKDPLQFSGIEGNIIAENILAEGKNVVIIGSGDTGSDCVGTSIRQKARSVTQIALLDKPGHERAPHNPWPQFALTYKTSSSHEEGCERLFATLAKAFVGDANGRLTGVKVADLKWEKEAATGNLTSVEIAGSERILPCELALIAIGFAGPEPLLAERLGLERDAKGNIAADETSYKTTHQKIYACGDMRRGQSLVVWAISEGRECARNVDASLRGQSSLLENKDRSLQTAAFGA